MQNNRLRIGVTMRVSIAKGYHEPRDALAHDWAKFLNVALPNAAWLPIPNLGEVTTLMYCEKWNINRLILTGGDDIGVFTIRDQTEQGLLKWAREHSVPVLGVCRGMQMMALSAGATLKKVYNHTNTRHQLQGDLLQEVNSFHHYGLANCPLGFDVSAISKDGVIEAIHNPELHWEGWMWHPEREKHFQADDISRLQRLFA